MAKCKNCAGELKFDPALGKLVCEYCDSVFEMAEYEAAKDQAAAEVEYYPDLYAFVCPNCAGELYTTDSSAATFCSYCGASVTLENRITSYQTPDYIIPFSISAEEAKNAYAKRLRKAPFAPSSLKINNKINKVRGIYMPYVDLEYPVNGEYDIITKKSTYSGDYEIVERYQNAGSADGKITDLHHDALTEYSDALSEGIEPYEFSGKVEYNPSYLSGFYADKADIGGAELSDRMKPKAQEKFVESVVGAVSPGSSYTVNKMPEVSDAETKTVLVPVWFVSNKSRNGKAVSYAAVNGQTGATAAELPIDRKKVLLSTLLFGVVAFLVLCLVITFTPRKSLILMTVLGGLALIMLNSETNRLYQKRHENDFLTEAKAAAEKPEKKVTAVDVLTGLLYGLLGLAALFFYVVNLDLLAAAAIGGIVLLSLLLKKLSAVIKKNEARMPFAQKLKYMAAPLAGELAALVIIIINPFRDTIVYGACLLVIATTVTAFLTVISVHNALTQRKIVQLGRRGGDENA